MITDRKRVEVYTYVSVIMNIEFPNYSRKFVSTADEAYDLNA